MTTLLQPLLTESLQHAQPNSESVSSPARPTGTSRNPFARPKPLSSNSFTRSNLLPTHSPQKTSSTQSSLVSTSNEVQSTPADKIISGNAHGTSSISKDKRQGWRLLWRGGLEIGRDGWRLDGITFFALLSFPSTPSQLTSNPFDVPLTTPGSASASASGLNLSPFPSLPSTDTDLCLSLESMRGRKYLQVRGIVDLPENEVLEGAGSDDHGGVQFPNAPLLAAYFTSLLCRNPTLSASGRTLNAIVIGLGDEGVEPSHSSSLLIYGQRQLNQLENSTSPLRPSLRLCVGRRKPPPPPPSAKKIRPGDPLPRPPLFFPVKSNKSLPMLSRRSKPLSRASSVTSIYLPPPPPVQPLKNASSRTLPVAPVSGRTPGRRGEKRKRPMNEGDLNIDVDEKKRRSGKIVPTRTLSLPDRAIDGERDKSRSRSNSIQPPITSRTVSAPTVKMETRDDQSDEEEDIFGKRSQVSRTTSIEPRRGTSKSVEPLTDGIDQQDIPEVDGSNLTGSGSKGKRVRVPQQVLDNKATIRKQALIMLEARGYQRSHDLFKDVFSLSTKGTYFVFRNELERGPLTKSDIQKIINNHLEMYLPDSSSSQVPPNINSSVDFTFDDINPTGIAERSVEMVHVHDENASDGISEPSNSHIRRLSGHSFGSFGSGHLEDIGEEEDDDEEEEGTS